MSEKEPQPKIEKEEERIEALSRLSEAEIIEMANLVLPGILTRMRKERGRIVAEEPWGYFDLPDTDTEGRKVPLIYLSTVGCFHALGRGGCEMCDYGWGGGKKKTEDLRRAIEEVFKFLEERNRGYEMGKYNINALGSFFDGREIPKELREEIYRRIAETKVDFKKIKFITESRLELITEDDLKKMRQILGTDVIIEIGYGVESTNRFIREVCINKHYPEDFEERLRLMKQYGIDRWAHVMLKPPFLTEGEAIQDASQSIIDSLDRDWAEQVILMSMNIRKGSLVGMLEEEGRYRLPYIWSIIEVLRRVGPERAAKLSLFGFVTASGKEKITKGCEICDEPIRGRILKWRGTEEEYNDLLRVADSIECPCKKAWQEEMEKVPPKDLKTRTTEEIDRLSQKYLGSSFIEEARARKARKKL